MLCYTGTAFPAVLPGLTGLLFPSLAEHPKDKQFSIHAAPGHPRGVGDDSEPAPAGTRVLGHAHCLQHW